MCDRFVRQSGPWDAALSKLLEWDPTWTGTCVKMTTNPWVQEVLSRKLIELVGVALNAACTNLNPGRHAPPHPRRARSRRHPRMKYSPSSRPERSVMSIHSCSLGAPILLEEARAAGAASAPKAQCRRNAGLRQR